MLAAALGARKEEHAAVPTRLRALCFRHSRRWVTVYSATGAMGLVPDSYVKI